MTQHLLIYAEVHYEFGLLLQADGHLQDAINAFSEAAQALGALLHSPPRSRIDDMSDYGPDGDVILPRVTLKEVLVAQENSKKQLGVDLLPP